MIQKGIGLEVMSQAEKGLSWAPFPLFTRNRTAGGAVDVEKGYPFFIRKSS